MPWTITTPIILWAVISIPVFILLWIFPPKNKLTAIIILSGFFAGSFYFSFAVNWSIINYWLRVLPLILFILLSFRFWRTNRMYYDFELDRKHVTPFLPGKGVSTWVVMIVSLLFLAFFAFMDFRMIPSMGYKGYSGKPVLLFFPARYGMYVVPNGGNGLDGLAMNDVYQDWQGKKTGNPQSMAYAVDMMKMINNRGWVSNGILPNEKQMYESFGDLVFAPCVGTVVYTEDGHADIVNGTPETSLGNHIVFQCFEYYVTVANLKKGSVIVKVGDKVGYKYQIGQVGSSGSPSIPHLRVFTTVGSWDENGTPVPQLFDTGFQFLKRNDIFLPPY
jgi:hypothetical protein